jgi:hypothetical protein
MGTFYSFESKNLTWKEFVYKEIESEHCKILQCSIKGRIAYLACKVNTGQVFGIVLHLQTLDGQKGYKPIEETGGPLDFDAPASLIKKLSPTDNKNALEWREKCLAQASKKLPKDGDIIEFELPISWRANNGETIQARRFTVRKSPYYSGLAYQSENGELVRIRNIKSKNYVLN